MIRVLAYRWAHLGWGVLMLVVGVAIGYALFSGTGDSGFSAIGDDVSLTSGGTVKRAGRYVDAGSIFGMLGVDDRTAAVTKAVEQGIIHLGR